MVGLALSSFPFTLSVNWPQSLGLPPVVRSRAASVPVTWDPRRCPKIMAGPGTGNGVPWPGGLGHKTRADQQGQAPTAHATMPPLTRPLRSWEGQEPVNLRARGKQAGVSGNTAPRSFPGLKELSLPVPRTAPNTPSRALGLLLAQCSRLRVSFLGRQK